MIDLKKEIKLSELVRRSAKANRTTGQTSSQASKANRSTGHVRKPGTRELVGIKIGATQLAAARVVNDRSPRLVQIARQPLPLGIVGEGEVRDVPALAAALNEFFTANDLPRRGVRLGIATNRVGVRTFEIAGVDDEGQLANAVLFRAHDAVSIPVEEAIIDYRVLNVDVDESGTVTRKILLVAAYRDPIERYVDAFREAGIRLDGIDLEAFALLRAVTPPRLEGSPAYSAVVAVNTGHERTTLAVSDGEVCEFTRVFAWGGARLAAAIAHELTIPLPEAGQVLTALSLGPGAESHGEDPRLERARVATARELQALGRELTASLQFYASQPGALPIAEILLAGGTSRIPGLVTEVERMTRVRVLQADPFARVAIDGDQIAGRDDAASLAVAIGLGVED